MIEDIVPEENREIFCYLFAIEVGLRELIIDLLSKIEGERWYKKRLPEEILEKYKNSLNLERKIRWTQLISHHPLYYIDFSDLKVIIERNDNWNDVFKSVFGSNKIIIQATLEELNEIRNKIAHNRKATAKDQVIVKAAYNKILKTIGEDRFNILILKLTSVIDIKGLLKELRNEAKRLFYVCMRSKKVDNLEIWERISKKWWFDEIYLDSKIESIIEYFTKVEEYSKIPIIRGGGYKKDCWVKDNKIEYKYKNAELEFSVIFANEVLENEFK
jgi:hypothetical protein